MRKMTALLAAFAMASATYAANPFSDVPRTHWAYSAIQRAVDAGVLQGFDGKFHGEKLVNRYQMAVIIKKILDNVGSSGSSSGMSRTDIQNLEALTIEFADELALLNVKVSTLEDSFTELRNEVSKMKMGGGHGASSAGLTNAFTGFIAVSLVSTDDGTNVPAAGAAAARAAGMSRYHGAGAAGTVDQTFFTIPQASIALDTEVGDGIGLHVQYDYSTDAPSSGAGGIGGNGVGLNEAYLFVDELFGNVGAKIGGFALPFQSWEVNGPFRTLNDTITPSSKGTFLESIRVIGFELQRTKGRDSIGNIDWHFGVFNGRDLALPGAAGAVPAAPGSVGLQSDAVGLGGVTGNLTNDDSLGFYIDIESGENPDRHWGWRIGWFDLGGDSTPGAGAVAATASQEIDGWQIGFWFKRNHFKAVFEWMNADNEFAAGAGGENEMDAWYFLLNYQINDNNSLTLRYDDWENELNSAPRGGTEGDSITFAWNRRVSDTSMFQFEYIAPDNETIGAAFPGDVDDDLVQFRYKVWF